MRKRFKTSIQRSTFSLRRTGERGIALVLTLAIITLVTVLLIAFATSMRVENSASKNFNDFIKARELAQAAMDQAVATIRDATTRSGTVKNYVTFPGVAYDFDGATTTRKALYSVNAADTTNLNAVSDFWITSNSGEFTVDTASKFNVGWVYVAEDGSVYPPTVSTKPLVGRFAFWVDDEASKINLNTAGKPTVTTPPSPDYGYSVSNEVDPSVLLGGMPASALAIQTRKATFGFTTIEEVKLADPNASDYSNNWFSLTAYSYDASYPNYADDLDAFGRQRLPLDPVALNTAVNFAGPGDGAFARLSDATTLGTIYGGKTFADKYPALGGVDGLKQIIANIIAYQINPNATPPPDGGSSPPVYLGLAKTPYINEVQVSYAVNSSAATVTRSVSVELFYMYDGNYTPGTEQITISGLPTAGGLFSATATITPPAGAYASGTYRVCTETAEPVANLAGTTTVTPAPPGTPTQVSYERQYGVVFNRLDYGQMILPDVILDPTVSSTPSQDAEANDPAVNDVDGTWTKTVTIGTMGSQNGAYSQTADPTLGVKALPSKVIMRATPMQSLGELGYIHRPEPWRHLTLQPLGGGGVIPDWAILDFFTVGNTVIPNYVVTGGRININSFINPQAVPPGPSTPRLVPLEALLNSLSSVIAPTPVATVAHQIYNDDNVTAPIARAADPYGMNFIFDTVGEICEISSLIPGGAPTEAQKEAAIRRIANLITVRSNTFTIWIVAQSIKQPPITPTPGTFTPTIDQVTGEVRAQAVVERYETNPGNAGSLVRFRVRYFRYL